MSFFSVLAAVSSLTATAVATSQIVPVTEDSVIRLVLALILALDFANNYPADRAFGLAISQSETPRI
jgi:hypothetical protein